MSEIGVIHLVWVPLGLESLRAFLDSYSRNRGGVAHDLLIVFNGHHSEEELKPFQTLLRELPCQTLTIARPGHDIRSYSLAAKAFDRRHLCFLNSYTTLLDADWLAKLFDHLTRQGVGLVGATGSWESAYSVEQQRLHGSPPLPLLRRMWKRWTVWRLSRWFNPFPNYHIRTNGFLISRDLFLSLGGRRAASKMHALRFESGKQSLTNQVLQKGLNALVVARDGKAFEKEEWWASGTFRQGDQANLLLADNRTQEYAKGSPQRREHLAKLAWGEKAFVYGPQSR
jgi:hypothetical protein